MSYEGYSQFLCKKGHYWESDCYIDDDTCPTCGKKAIWKEMVDTTNDEGNPAKLNLKSQKKCKKCGSVLERIYHIPTNNKPKKEK